jgi:branched-subunit amino acid ABC-type transport system permease component
MKYRVDFHVQSDRSIDGRSPLPALAAAALRLAAVARRHRVVYANSQKAALIAMLACALAAVGGVLMSSIGGITYGLVETGLKAFSVVILGGLDSFLGAMIAGPVIGLAETVGGGYLTPLTWQGVREVIPFIVIIIVMFIKPYGLFGEERIERI